MQVDNGWLLDGARELKTLTSKNVHCLSWDQKFVAATSKRAPSSRFVDLRGRCSPDKGWRGGSTWTFEQTFCYKLAVISHSSLCRMIVYPPCEQLRQWSTVNGLLQTQLVGRPFGSQPYLKQRASLNDDLCRGKLCSSIGSTDSAVLSSSARYFF